MARITLRQLLDHAAEHGYGVPAFNMNNLEQGLAIMAAAEKTRSPVILQASRGARAYAGDVILSRMIDGFVTAHPDIPVCMHLDHGNEPGTCATAIQHGFTSVMMDGSLKADGKTPADYTYNAGVTARVSDMAHACGVSVEGEIGVLGSLEFGGGEQEDGHGVEGTLSHDQLLTDPEDAVRFVAETKVDALAVAMGTSHGAYKFTRRPDGDVLAMSVIEEIHRRLPDTHLVMHGSLVRPGGIAGDHQPLRRRDKADMGRAARGDPRGIKHGVRKVNIDTDNRMAMTGAIRKVFAENPHEFDPRKYLVPAIAAMKKLCIERFEAFGTAGHADKLKPLSLDAMARRYASGDLDPAVT